MARRKKSRALFITTAVLIVLLLAVGGVVLVKSFMNNDDTAQQTSSDTSADTSLETDAATVETDDAPAASDTSTPIDPSTVETLDIRPMDITISYVKGIGGFEFEVLRTSSGTSYVEFRNEDLIGTKCTNDQGTFASILEDPSSNESGTLNQKTTVEGTVYGLSLSGAACTGNSELLEKYQKSFSDGFPLLKKME